MKKVVLLFIFLVAYSALAQQAINISTALQSSSVVKVLPITSPNCTVTKVGSNPNFSNRGYKIVAKLADGVTQAAASAECLGVGPSVYDENNYMQVSWEPVVGAAFYDVYRNTAAGYSVGLIAENTPLTSLQDRTETACNTSDLFYKSFEVSEGWEVVDVSGTAGDWVITNNLQNPTKAPYSGSYGASFNSFDSAAGSQTRLWNSNYPFLVTSCGLNKLSFYLLRDNTYPANPDTIQVQVSTDTTTWINVGDPILRYKNVSTPMWEEIIVDLSEYENKTIYLGFLGISAYGSNINIDYIKVKKYNVTTPILNSTGAVITENIIATTGIFSGTITASNIAENLDRENIVIGSSGFPLDRISASGIFGNVSIGKASMASVETGDNNVSIGSNSLNKLTSGNNNISIGYFSLSRNTMGTANVSIGGSTLEQNVVGNYNTAMGVGALAQATGSYNTAIGNTSGYSVTDASQLTLLGYFSNATGSITNSTAIGVTASVNASNTVVLGNNSVVDIFAGSNKQATVQAKSLQLNTAAKPACDATKRGSVWYVAGGAGVADTFEVCRKDNVDAYAWVSVY